jgi:hypothetical protein
MRGIYSECFFSAVIFVRDLSLYLGTDIID